MRSLSRIRSSAKPVLPGPTRTSRVLFDGGTRRRSPYFGRGILRSLPTYRTAYTAADAAWASQAFAPSAYDAELDRRAEESAWMDRYEAGIAS